jgi:hypothetical protein
MGKKLDQSSCNHRFAKEALWIFEGAAIKRLLCVDCQFRLFYVDPVAKEIDYKASQGGKDETETKKDS